MSDGERVPIEITPATIDAIEHQIRMSRPLPDVGDHLGTCRCEGCIEWIARRHLHDAAHDALPDLAAQLAAALRQAWRARAELEAELRDARVGVP